MLAHGYDTIARGDHPPSTTPPSLSPLPTPSETDQYSGEGDLSSSVAYASLKNAYDLLQAKTKRWQEKVEQRDQMVKQQLTEMTREIEKKDEEVVALRRRCTQQADDISGWQSTVRTLEAQLAQLQHTVQVRDNQEETIRALRAQVATLESRTSAFDNPAWLEDAVESHRKQQGTRLRVTRSIEIESVLWCLCCLEHTATPASDAGRGRSLPSLDPCLRWVLDSELRAPSIRPFFTWESDRGTSKDPNLIFVPACTLHTLHKKCTQSTAQFLSLFFLQEEYHRGWVRECWLQCISDIHKSTVEGMVQTRAVWEAEVRRLRFRCDQLEVQMEALQYKLEHGYEQEMRARLTLARSSYAATCTKRMVPSSDSASVKATTPTASPDHRDGTEKESFTRDGGQQAHTTPVTVVYANLVSMPPVRQQHTLQPAVEAARIVAVEPLFDLTELLKHHSKAPVGAVSGESNKSSEAESVEALSIELRKMRRSHELLTTELDALRRSKQQNTTASISYKVTTRSAREGSAQTDAQPVAEPTSQPATHIDAAGVPFTKASVPGVVEETSRSTNAINEEELYKKNIVLMFLKARTKPSVQRGLLPVLAKVLDLDPLELKALLSMY